MFKPAAKIVAGGLCLLLMSAVPAWSATCTHDLPPLANAPNGGYSPHTVGYKKKAAVAGDLISIAGADFRIVRIPFVEFQSGQRYALVYPARLASSFGVEQFAVSFATSHVIADACNDIHVPGVPNPLVEFNIFESRTFHFSAISPSPSPGTNQLLVTRTMSLPLVAQIRQTFVSLAVSLTRTEIQMPVPSGEYNLEGDIDISKMNHKLNPTLAQLNQLIDYIYIEKL